MNFTNLMQELERLLEVEHLTPNDDGEYVVQFDGWLEVRICLLDRSTVLLQSVVGQEPSDEFEAQYFLEKVLRCGLIHYRRPREVASLEPDTGEIHLYRMVDLESLTPLRLHEFLEQFVDAAEFWSKQLTDTQLQSTTPPPMMMLMP
jgi:hypothetical protein